MSTTDNRSVAELFTDALNQFSNLVRNELQLARKELSFKAGEAMTAGDSWPAQDCFSSLRW